VFRPTCSPRPATTPLAKVRQWCFDLTKRSLWPNADPGEANADRAMVKKLRKKYGF
jgi:hypothetical protein